MTEFGAEHGNPNSFYFALAAMCILIHLHYPREKFLWPTELGMLKDLYVYNPALKILEHESFVLSSVIKSADNPLPSPILAIWEWKRKMSELSERQCSHTLVKNSTVNK